MSYFIIHLCWIGCQKGDFLGRRTFWIHIPMCLFQQECWLGIALPLHAWAPWFIKLGILSLPPFNSPNCEAVIDLHSILKHQQGRREPATTLTAMLLSLSSPHRLSSVNLLPDRGNTVGLVICANLSRHLHCELCYPGASVQRSVLGGHGRFVILVKFLINVRVVLGPSK